ncbi:MAG TPA: deaminase [Streptosporangiaceae bacterium]|nr:deaminase [Streptosporangiaceae bacterium]
MKQVLLYLPVIHAGYERFLQGHADAGEVLVLGAGFTEHYPGLAKDIRALPPERAAAYLRLACPAARVRVAEPGDLPDAVHAEVLVLPDETVTRDLVSAYGLAAGRTVLFERTFLRWDRAWATVLRHVTPDGETTVAQLPREMLRLAVTLSERSSDWWRQVGAVAARGGQVLGCAWNSHYPTEYAPYLNGDPRDSFERGVRADLSTALHAEAAVVARAARDGVSLAGADLYTTTFPCPACARLIAEAGFRRCFFTGQYSVLDGEQVLRAAGVRLIWVDTAPETVTVAE